MKRISIVMIICLLLSVFVSCNNDDSVKEPETKALHVSVINPDMLSSKAVLIGQTKSVVGAPTQKECITSGTLITSVTPESFTIQLQSIFLYQPEDNADVTKGSKEEFKLYKEIPDGNGSAFPRRINVNYTKDLKIDTPDEVFETTWQGFGFEIDVSSNSFSDGPTYAQNNSVDHYYTGATVVVKLTQAMKDAGITKDALSTYLYNPESFVTSYGEDYVFLDLQKICPYQNDPLKGFTKVLFQTGLSSNERYINVWNRPQAGDTITYGPYTVRDELGTCVAGNMKPIDFTNIADCELFIVFNTTNMIQFYSYGGNIIPVLNPADPYPISLYAAKNDSLENKAESVAGAKPKDCASYLRPNGFALCFSYPDSNDVDHFEIYKSTGTDQRMQICCTQD